MAERRPTLDELLHFPCIYEFKAFGTAIDADGFGASVKEAVGKVVPVGQSSLRSRQSSAGNYLCVTVRVQLQNSAQLAEIYANLKTVAGLRYLL